jgi:uncharacterized membrane protein YraQ (UPF0718 family)
MSERRRKAKVKVHEQVVSQLQMPVKTKPALSEAEADRRAKLDRIGSFSMDVAKYVLTGVIISPMFHTFENKFWVYGLGLLVVLIFMLLGVMLTRYK